MPSSAEDFGDGAEQQLSVDGCGRLRSNFARRQSGRMAEKICVWRTWPAMTERVTPSARKVSISSRARRARASARGWRDRRRRAPSISGFVSSLMAATTTVRPCARAASEQQEREAAVAGNLGRGAARAVLDCFAVGGAPGGITLPPWGVPIYF